MIREVDHEGARTGLKTPTSLQRAQFHVIVGLFLHSPPQHLARRLQHTILNAVDIRRKAMRYLRDTFKMAAPV